MLQWKTTYPRLYIAKTNCTLFGWKQTNKQKSEKETEFGGYGRKMVLRGVEGGLWPTYIQWNSLGVNKDIFKMLITTRVSFRRVWGGVFLMLPRNVQQPTGLCQEEKCKFCRLLCYRNFVIQPVSILYAGLEIWYQLVCPIGLNKMQWTAVD